MNSGSNGLISSKKLRRSIFDYYTMIEDAKKSMTTGVSPWRSILSAMIPGEYKCETLEREMELILNTFEIRCYRVTFSECSDPVVRNRNMSDP